MNELGSKKSIWRVSVDGGEPVQVVAKESSYPRVSPDGNYLAAGFEENGKTSLAVFAINGGGSVKLFDVPKTFNFYDAIRWTPDGKAITYRDWANGLWRQSVEGDRLERVEGLPQEKFLTYAWSRNGDHLAFYPWRRKKRCCFDLKRQIERPATTEKISPSRGHLISAAQYIVKVIVQVEVTVVS
jgi:Tol biopolymer transport system component